MSKTTIYLITVLSFLLIGCAEYHSDCNENGHFAEGDCICDPGYGFIECEYHIPTEFTGYYVLDTAICDSLPIPWSRMHLRSSPDSEILVLIETIHLVQPITGVFGKLADQKALIEQQQNFLLDSTGTQTPIQLEGEISFSIDLRHLALNFKNPSCYVSFIRQ